MKRLLLALLLGLPSWAHAQLAGPLMLNTAGTAPLPPRPYWSFTGSGVSCALATVNGFPTNRCTFATGAGGTLQTAYDNGNGTIALTATSGLLGGPINIRDNVTPLGTSLLTVQSAGGGTSYLDVLASTITLGATGGTNITKVVGRATIEAVNAGAGAATSQIVPSMHNSATVNYAIEVGTQALIGGTATVTFSPAFNAVPSCQCTDQSNEAAPKCAPSATQLVINVGSSTDTIAWLCVGAR